MTGGYNSPEFMPDLAVTKRAAATPSPPWEGQATSHLTPHQLFTNHKQARHMSQPPNVRSSATHRPRLGNAVSCTEDEAIIQSAATANGGLALQQAAHPKEDVLMGGVGILDQ